MAGISISLQNRIAFTLPRARLVDAAPPLIFALLLLLIVRFPLNVNHDAALFLETGSLILDGKQPYVDFDEINFPLVMYLHAVPVEIGRLLNVNPIPVFSVLVLALAVGSAWTVRHLLSAAYGGEIPLALRLIPAFIALYTLYLFLIADYGQREHLFVLLFLPGLILRWVRWQGGTVGRRTALLIGLLAAVGASIKPHFLVIAFVPELYWIASALRRDGKAAWKAIRPVLLTPDVLAFVGFGALYALVLLLTPTIRHALFEQILPYITSRYTDYDMGVTPFSLLVRLDTVLVWVALVAALPLVRRNRPLVRPLWLLTLAAALVFCWQGKGWYYHRIPATFGACLLILMTLVQRDPYDLPLIDPLLKLLLVLLMYGIITLGGVVLVGQRYPGLHDAIDRYTNPGDPVLFINSGVTPEFPLLMQMGRQPGDGNLSGYPLSADAGSDPDISQYLDSIRASLAARHPALILIDTEVPCYGCSADYSFWQYLESTGYIDRFITPGYRDAGTVEQYEIYLPK